MTRRPTCFRQIDVSRALKAARAAGFDVERVEIDQGGSIIMMSKRVQAEASNELDQWMAERARGANARKT